MASLWDDSIRKKTRSPNRPIYPMIHFLIISFVIILKIMEQNPLQNVVKRIKEHGVSYKIQELCLDEIKLILLTQQISQLIEKCHKIQHLSLCGCQLSSLLYFPNLPALSKLQLSNNNLESQHLEPLAKCSRLYSLSLHSNFIKDFGWTRHLKRTRLAEITLQGNPIASDPQYRQKVYKGLGADLDILDGVDRQGNFVEESDSSDQESEQQMDSGQVRQSEENENSSQNDEAEDSLNKKIKIEEQKQSR